MNAQLIMLIGPATALGIGLIIGIVMFLRGRSRRKTPGVTQEPLELAYVYQDKRCKLEHISASELEHLGSIKRQLGTKLLHLLERSKSGKLQTVSLERLRANINITPADLYGAIHWETQVALFKVEATMLQKIKVAILVALAVIVMLGLFLIVAAMFGD